MSSPKDMRHRAHHGLLWYDQIRQTLLTWTDEVGIVPVLYDLYTTAQGDCRPAIEKTLELASIEYPTRAILNHWARSLPIPLDTAVPLIEGLSRIVSDPRIPDHLDWAGHAARHLQSQAIIEMLVNGASLMTMDADLAHQLVKSSNYPIDDALLLLVPFPRTFIEFSKPVRIADHRFIAASFYADEMREIWCASLYYEGNALKTYTWGRCGKVQTGQDEYLSNDEQNELRHTAYRVALHNIWDFVTSRSVSIERVKRSRNAILKGAPKHVQGAKSTLPREVFLLTVNRTIRVPDDQGPRRDTHEWAYQVEVPGAFHRWVYCASCGDVHRQDLIGMPCRECGKIVGPKSNIRIEKYWHPPHTRGPKDAPLKEAVREIGRRKR